MKSVYLLSMVTEEDVSSSVFELKANALAVIAKEYSEYKKIAENKPSDIECWHKHTGECILLEKLKVED